MCPRNPINRIIKASYIQIKGLVIRGNLGHQMNPEIGIRNPVPCATTILLGYDPKSILRLPVEETPRAPEEAELLWRPEPARLGRVYATESPELPLLHNGVAASFRSSEGCLTRRREAQILKFASKKSIPEVNSVACPCAASGSGPTRTCDPHGLGLSRIFGGLGRRELLSNFLVW